jgi:hypothetical protein
VDYDLNDGFLTEYFVGPELRGVVEEVTNSAVMLAQSEIAKRTGLLASTIHGSASVEPVLRGDSRWVGSVDVGGQGSAGSPLGVGGVDSPSGLHNYAASYEFGAGNHPGSTGRHTNRPAHILDRVREQLGAL